VAADSATKRTNQVDLAAAHTDGTGRIPGVVRSVGQGPRQEIEKGQAEDAEMNLDESRTLAHAEVDRLSSRGLATILAALQRICPRCEGLTYVRNSRPAGGARLTYRRCPDCGWRSRKGCKPTPVDLVSHEDGAENVKP
jgi:hypothetical protein